MVDYDHGVGCSVIGGYVYRGSAISGLRGTYFYGDFCNGWVKSFRYLAGNATEQTDWPDLAPVATSPASVRTLEESCT